MKILIVHNRYRIRGGEDAVAVADAEGLAARGHEVRCLFFDNRDIEGGARSYAQVALRATYSKRALGEVARIGATFRPDVLHVHNLFPLVSPAILRYGAAQGYACVMTLHNYRLACLPGTLLRNGEVCRDCLGKVPWRGVIRGCYRSSIAQSAALGMALQVHRTLGTWSGSVHRYLALTGFMRQTMVGAGLPAERVGVRANALRADPVSEARAGGHEPRAVCVGRISEEKGIRRLAEHWSGLPLWVVGDGPEMPELRAVAERNPSVTVLGRREPEEVSTLLSMASVLVLPSIWYEGLPMVVLESLGLGVPVVYFSNPNLESVFGDQAGAVPTGDWKGLVELANEIATNHELAAPMRARARERYVSAYSRARSFAALEGEYALAMEQAKRGQADAESERIP